MKALFLLIFSIYETNAISQFFEIEWEKSFGGASYKASYTILQTQI
jgi:hypothetical protein